MTSSDFRTADLSLAAVLYSQNYRLASLEKEDFQKVQFVFERDTQLDTLVQAYWTRDLKIEPQLLFAAQKAVKNRLYQDR